MKLQAMTPVDTQDTIMITPALRLLSQRFSPFEIHIEHLFNVYLPTTKHIESCYWGVLLPKSHCVLPYINQVAYRYLQKW